MLPSGGWLQGPAKEWNAQIRSTWSRAATSVQRLAEQAELQQLGDKVLASAHSLAEQGEAALRASKESVVDGVAALGLLPEKEGRDDASSLVDGQDLRQFKADVCTLKNATSGVPTDEEILKMLSRWVELLYAEGTLKPVALDAFLQNHALQVALVALACRQTGREAIRAAAMEMKSSEGSPGNSAVAGLLCKILACTSAAPPALLSRLLELLANIAEATIALEDKRGSKDTKNNTATPVMLLASKDVQWVLDILSAALIDIREAPLFEITQRKEMIDRTLVATSATNLELGTRVAFDADATPTGSPASLPNVGDRVWAEWLGDGRWYHAQVHSIGNEQVQVTWLHPPKDVECGQDVEYLLDAIRDVTQHTWLMPTAVVPSHMDRPGPAFLTGEENWMKQVEAVDAFGTNFCKLRELCEDFMKCPPTLAASAVVSAEEGLEGTAGSLRALREHSAREAESLARAVASSSTAGQNCEHQVNSTKSDADNGLVALQQEEQKLHTRKMQLMREREELHAKLRALDEELARIEAASVKMVEHRCNLNEGTERQRFLVEVSSASSDVEALLATRAQKAAGAEAAVTALDGCQQAVATACLGCEQKRCRQLENLLAGMHAFIWGSEVDQLARDPARLKVMRKLQCQASGLVEQAWRQMVQLAAETLSTDSHSLGAASEDMTRSAKRYKEMRHELQTNLDRLAKLEAESTEMQQPGFQPPPRMPQSLPGISAPTGSVANQGQNSQSTESVLQGIM